MTKTIESILTLDVGDRVLGNFLVKQCMIALTKTGRPYASLVLSDPTGSIEAKAWSIDPDEFSIEAGMVVAIRGELSQYQDVKEIRLKDITPFPEERPEDYLERVDVPQDQLIYEFGCYYQQIENSAYKQLITDLTKREDLTTSLFDQPLSPEGLCGSLAKHTVQLLKQADLLCEVYPQLNKDLLLTAMILHGFGLRKALNSPVNPEWTAEGILLGSGYLVDQWIIESATEHLIDLETLLPLRHCLKVATSSEFAQLPEALVLQHCYRLNRVLENYNQRTDSNYLTIQDYLKGVDA